MNGAERQWQRIGLKTHHGIDVPLFSLHSDTSGGIGEFTDLIPLATWCHGVGMDVIQLLPLNDTGIDPSPYSLLSAFALAPIHLNLSSLPNPKVPLPVVPKTPRIQYEIVRESKDRWLRAYFQQEFSTIKTSKAYRDFISEHRDWIDHYALFKSLKVQLKWSPWRSWPSEVLHPAKKTLEALHREHRQEVDYHSFVQYLCFNQLQEVKKVINAQGVFLKGDIPICCGAESAEAWSEPELFLPDVTAGAPPDMYNAEGQNWGFPVYDWTLHEARDFRWWKRRLSIASLFYDIYRLDHIVGLFRIWAIPMGTKVSEGGYIPKDESVWVSHGRKILQMMLSSCPMLPIGEDLGTIPPATRACMQQLGICGTKVMRWERDWHGDRNFIPILLYPIESMTTVSTHDSETLTQWWENQAEESRLFADRNFWEYTTSLTEQERFEILRQSHRSRSLFHINLLSEYLALIPDLIWPDPQMERINVPGTILDTNWTYRCRPTVQEIVTHDELKKVVMGML